MNMDFSMMITIPPIINYVKPLTKEYRKYPLRKSEIVDKLRPVFSADSDVWGVVIDLNEFKVTFRGALGKKNMSALKSLLYELDYDHYKNIDFDKA